MADDTYHVAGKVTLDTSAASRSARDHRQQVDALTAANARLAAKEKRVKAEVDALRKSQVDLLRADVDGTRSKKELAQESKRLRLANMQLAESTRAVREAKQQLRAEEKQLQAELRETARAARDSAREQVAAAREAVRVEAQIVRDRAAAARARQRSADLDVRARGLRGVDVDSARRVNALETSIADSDARLQRLTGRPLGRTRTAIEDAFGRARERFRSGEGLSEAAGQLGSGLRSAASVGAGVAIGGVTAVGGAAAGIAQVGANFEKLRASLETIEGSRSKAEATFAAIQEFARTTPYGLQETTTALVKLKARGLDASLPALKSYGDTASAMGKSLDDVVEAVADATTGEFERLKELGIKASSQGDKVSLTFKGVTTTVRKDSKEIERYLQQVGRVNFSGGMARQAQTLEGQLSGLGDTVAQLADTAFRSGLGDAIKEVVADMTGLAGEGDDLAKVIGKKLGDAVRGAYEWFKRFIGPVDQLDEKFEAAWKVAQDFVGTLTTAVGAVTSLVSSIGGANTALAGMALGLVALTGPLGAVAALGVTLGATLVRAFTDSGDALYELQQKAHAAWQDDDRARRKSLEASADQTLLENEQRRKADTVIEKIQANELRRLGVKSEFDLSASERKRINELAYGTRDALLGKGQAGARAFGGGDFESRLANFESGFKGREKDADKAEFDRLNARRKSLTPSEKKRLNELSKELDVNVSKGGGKAKLDAFAAERKKEIDDLVKREELRAGDAALASGAGASGASKAAREAGRAARERYAGMDTLPGEVERSLLRQAGFEDVQNAPPPPVIVYQQTFHQNVQLMLDAVINTTGDPEAVGDDIGQATKTSLERDILPRVAELTRSAIRR